MIISKKWFYPAIICVVMIVLAGACLHADNMVPNSSFENFTAGTTYGPGDDVWVDTWRFYGGGTTTGGSLTAITPGQDGNIAIQLARTSMSGDTALNSGDIPVTPSRSYRITVWAKSDTNAQFLLNVAAFIDHYWGTFLGDTACTITASPMWKKYVMIYTTSSACTDVSLSLRPRSASGNVCLDNVSIEETNELFPDPSFDDYTLGATYSSETFINTFRFYGGDCGGVMTVVDGRDEGGTAIQLSRTSASGDSAFGNWNLIPVKAGHTYRIMGWAKSDSSTPLCLTVASYNSTGIYGGWIEDTIRLSYSTCSKWGLCPLVYTAPENAAGVQIGFRAWDVGSVIFDDFTMVDETNLTGNLYPDPSFDSYILDTVYNSDTVVGPFRYFSSSESGGTMTIVPGKDDGGTAIKLARTSDNPISYDAALSFTTANKIRIPVKYGNVYSFKFWAKASALPSRMRATLAGYLSNATTWFKDNDYFVEPGIDWTECSYVYTPPSTAVSYINPGFRTWYPTSDTTIDNVEITDITSSYKGTLTGTITNALTGTAIAGATVVIDGSLSAATGSDGVYTIDEVPAGTHSLVAMASGYNKTSLLNVGVSITSTQDIGLFPADTNWVVYDHFNREIAQSEDSLGTTEDLYQVPWVKTVPQSTSWYGNINSSVANGTMITSYGDDQVNKDPCGVSLARNFMPADFDLSINMNWLETMQSWWSGISYRQSQPAAMSEGYFIDFPYQGDKVYLQYKGTTIATATLPTTYENWQNVIVHLVVCGNSHKIYLNDVLVLDVTDDSNTGAGFIGMFCDTKNSVAWDDLNISAVPNGMITGSVYDDVTGAPIPDATVTIAETVSQLQTDSGGIYSVSAAPGKYTLTASAEGYVPQTKSATVTSGNTATVDFNMILNASNVNTIADAKKLADKTQVAINETLVASIASSTFNDNSYYVENADRTYGIKILNGKAATVGSRITNLAGKIDTDSNGERYIDAASMAVISGDPVGALGMTNKAAVDSMVQGLLVKTWGKITFVASDKSYFYINDGSNIDDGSGNLGIRVDLANQAISRLAGLFVDEAVSVTGAMGYVNNGTASVKVIRPKSSLDINNTVVNNMTVTSADTSWILQVASGTGSIAFASAADTLYGSGNVLISESSDGTGVINLRTTSQNGIKIADITELSISNYMASINATGAKGIGVRISVNLDDDSSNGDVDDILTCDPYYNPYTYALCQQNSWVTFDALNAGYWYSAQQLDGSSDAGPWKTLKDYLSLYPDAKIANYSTGGLRFFMGGSHPHWDNVTGYIDNIRVGTKDGVTVYNFE